MLMIRSISTFLIDHFPVCTLDRPKSPENRLQQFLILSPWSTAPSQCFYEHRTGPAAEAHEGFYRDFIQYRQNFGPPLVSSGV